MKHTLIRVFFMLGIIVMSAGALSAFALTDTYFATGEDLDFLIESDNTEGIQEIEYELRQFVLFRKVEDFLLDLSDTYQGEED